MLGRFWRALPWDGLGWGRSPDPVLSDLRAWAAASWRQAQARPWRPLLGPGARAGWPLAALGPVLAFARARGLDGAATARLYGDCLLTGGGPVDVYVWRSLWGGLHPLPGRGAGLLLSRLGDSTGHALLADKLEAAERLAMADIPVPVMRGVYRRGAACDVSLLADAAPGQDLFLKPRHGQGGRDAFALTRLDGVWHMGGRPVSSAELMARLARLVLRDDLLVQERLVAAQEVADLAVNGRAPVLRLATARLPGQAPFLHSALLTLAVPGRNPRHFLEGAVHAPVDPAEGRLVAGLTLAAPQTRLDRLTWNGALLAGRSVPGFAQAAAMVLRAMAALPPLPLVHWDLIPTEAGPVLLEGNSCGNWILACLPGLHGLEACPLPPLLARWLPDDRRL